MPDISACGNTTCQKRETCYRYLCVWDMMQSFSRYAPSEDGECSHYLQSSPRFRVVTLSEADRRANGVE
jgi:hypothetical protein